MKPSQVRTWLGLYVLILTTAVGAWILLAGGSPLLPLEKHDVTSSFEIIVPFLLAQVAVVFRYYGGPAPKEHTRRRLPAFIVKGPPLMVTGLLVLLAGLMAHGGVTGSKFTPSPEVFKGTLTFAVAILNATSVYLVTAYFETSRTVSGRSTEREESE